MGEESGDPASGLGGAFPQDHLTAHTEELRVAEKPKVYQTTVTCGKRFLSGRRGGGEGVME